MGSRASLNKVLLIGNLTRDPELRYTPSGAAVCTFGIATNRFYVASDGTKREEAEFIKIVSWNKLAELCSQLLTKGRKVYVEGRMQTRTWETPDGQSKQTTEVVIDDMRILDPKRGYEESVDEDIVLPRESAPQKSEPTQTSPSEEKPEGQTESETKGKKAADEKKKPREAKAKEGSEDKEDLKGEEGAVESSGSKAKDEDKIDLDDLPF